MNSALAQGVRADPFIDAERSGVLARWIDDRCDVALALDYGSLLTVKLVLKSSGPQGWYAIPLFHYGEPGSQRVYYRVVPLIH